MERKADLSWLPSFVQIENGHEQHPSALASFARGVAQAVTFGLNDEVAEGIALQQKRNQIRQIMELLYGDAIKKKYENMNPIDANFAYMQELDRLVDDAMDRYGRAEVERRIDAGRQKYKEAEHAHPWVFLAGEVAGATPWALAGINPSDHVMRLLSRFGLKMPTSLWGRTLKMGAANALDSAAYATATGRGNIVERITKAKEPAAYAGALGAAAPNVGKTVGLVMKKTAPKIAQMLGKVLSKAGTAKHIARDVMAGPHTGIGIYNMSQNDHSMPHSTGKTIKELIIEGRKLGKAYGQSSIPYAEDMYLRVTGEFPEVVAEEMTPKAAPVIELTKKRRKSRKRRGKKHG